MYQKSSGLTKFAVLFSDVICIVISVLLADFFWHDLYKHISRGGARYTRLLFILLAIYMVIFLFTKSYGEFYVRGFILEMWAVVKANIFLLLGATLVLFLLKESETYSRMVLVIFAVANCIFMWASRLIMKKFLPYVYSKMITKRNAIIVGDADFIKDIARELFITKDYSIDLVGACAYEAECEGDIDGIPLVATVDNLEEYCLGAAIDEVIIQVVDAKRENLVPIMDDLASAGIIIKYRSKLPKLNSTGCQAVAKAGDYLVATYATRSVSTGNLLVKRASDICAGIIGSIVTVLITVFVAPAIVIESKGPVFFSQKRVGRNGRIFTIYKFRSMYADAEERKEELMKHNEMSGNMFKMADDPRITKVGKFLRKTSLDEFPQFFNVLTGDMSLVGTRPPTIDEFNKYNLDQKGRLSFRPGLTGLWQVSGRNDISDFDTIVALDKEYIRNWSPLFDLKIILRTIPVMLSGK